MCLYMLVVVSKSVWSLAQRPLRFDPRFRLNKNIMNGLYCVCVWMDGEWMILIVAGLEKRKNGKRDKKINFIF